MTQSAEAYHATQWLGSKNLGKVQQMIHHYFGLKDVIHPTEEQTIFLSNRRLEINQLFYNNTILSDKNKIIYDFDISKSQNIAEINKGIRDTVNKKVFGIDRQWNSAVVRCNLDDILQELKQFDGISQHVDIVLANIRIKLMAHKKK